jgi:integrase
MFPIAPEPGRHKWNLRFRNHDGKVVKVSADEDRLVAIRIGNKIDMLIKAKQQGDPPPGELATWIDNMPESLSKRLVALGLLPQRYVGRSKPLLEHIDIFQKLVSIRQPNRQKQAKHQAGRVRIVCKALNAQQFADLTATKLLEYLDARGAADATRRGYIIVMKDFAKEMVRLGVARENPFTRYFQQKSRWTAADRRIIYWTAVKTAFRQSELRSLRKANFHLDETPASIGLKARDAKNRTEGEVPIPRALADALKLYVADLEPNDKVFPLPETSGSIVDMMRRDLKGAGIPWKLTTGEVVDFHTLRSTAISWWLDVDKLSPKRVQTLARLKTLALVYKYSRKWRIGDHDWLDEGPTW